MIMCAEADLFRWIYPNGDRIERVLHTAPNLDFVIVYAFHDVTTDVESEGQLPSQPPCPCVPFQRSKLEIEQALASSTCRVESNDTWALGIEPRNDEELRQRDAAYDVLKPIIRDGRADLYSERRGPLIKAAIERTGWGKNKFYTAFRKLWKANMNANALTPAFRQRGGAGKDKFFVSRSTGAFISTKEDRSHMAKALKDFYQTRDEHSLEDTHTYLLRKFYTHPDGKIKERHPNYECFHYHARKMVKIREKLISRKGMRNFLKDFRPKLGSIRNNTTAPGDRVEVDSTPFDFNCVCELNRTLVVGKPYLYLAADCFSGAPGGFYLTLDPPSYLGAAMAIENSIRDKDEYLTELGIKAHKGAWPYRGKAKEYVADGGEIDSKQAETLEKGLDCTVTIVASFRPDWKGMVEMLIAMVTRHCKVMEGRIAKRNRGDRNSKLGAVLTLKEVERVVALSMLVIWKRYREQECLDRQMMEENVLPVPEKMYAWGALRRGAPRSIAKELVRLNLLPRVEATVRMNDSQFIEDLKGLSDADLFLKLNALGDASARSLKFSLELALKMADHVVVATHVFAPAK